MSEPNVNNAPIRLMWRLIHKLPWRVTRHVCDMCDEFPFDPKKIKWDGKTEK